MMNQATFIDPAKMNAGKVLFKIVKYAINMHVIARIWLYIRKYPWHHDEYKETYNYKEQTLLYRCKLYIYIYIFLKTTIAMLKSQHIQTCPYSSTMFSQFTA
jgi:hypothetical protein